jgi:hypothetical protein
MSTCFLKRFVPFMLTLIIGLGLGTFFQPNHTRTQLKTRLYVEHNRCRTTTTTTTLTRNYAGDSITPLAILFEPPARTTAAARRNHTGGVVELLVEYGVDGKARVLERLATLPDGLTEEAERVAELTQFRPQAVNGEPVAVSKIQSYYFEPGKF